jgi:hypothetical protein
MKQLLLFLFTLSSIGLWAQGFRGKVVDSETGESLPFVNITVNGTKKGTASDIDGNFFFSYDIKSVEYLEFSFIGYEKLKVEGIQDKQVYRMKEATQALQEVTVVPGLNPAHRIIKNAVSNKDQNRPKSLESFAYISYSKLVVGLNVDSVDATIDTITKTQGDSIVYLPDSSRYEMVEYAEKQHLFLVETVTERKYLAPARDNEKVLAQRTSGFKNPLFSLIATQMQAFSFYDNYFSMLGEDFLNPLTKGSTKKYIFIIEDTTYNDLKDTVYTIRFLPKPNYAFRPMKGRISINSKNWAVQNVIASPVWESNEDRLDFTIRQYYEKFDERTWFPVQLSAEAHFKRDDKNGSLPTAVLHTYIKDIEINPELKKSKISRADISIDELAVENANDILDQYRNDSLTSKESKTYQVIDSIGKAENLDRQLRILSTVASGKVPLYYVDLELDKIIDYNEYEGFRLGVGLHTNSRFSRWFKTGGYFAYGFKDRVWKYGYDVSIMLNKVYNLSVLGGYSFDIEETGGVNKFMVSPPRLVIADNYRGLFVEQFDQNSEAFFGFTFDPIPSLNAKLLYRRQNMFTIGSYRFIEQTEDGFNSRNGFIFQELALGLRYAPNAKVMEVAEYGRITLNEPSPVFYADIARNVPEWGSDQTDYWRVELKMNYTRKSLSYGRSIFEVQGGKVWGEVPFSKLFAGEANGITNPDIWERAQAFADRSSFETMRFNEFLNSAYVHVMFRQDFRSTLFKRGEFAPHIEVVTRAMWGMLENAENHQNINVQDLRNGYYESGLELNKLYEFNFFAIGLGTYYRYGPYALDDNLENFTVKLTSKFSF